MSELLKEDKFTIKLDKEYTLSPVNWNVWAGLENEFDRGLQGAIEQLKSKPINTTISLIYVFLKSNYPDITKEKIGALVNLSNEKAVGDTLGEYLKEVANGIK